MPVSVSKGLSVDKFVNMCKEFGGEHYKKTDYFANKEAEVCELMNFDDYEAFITWLNKQRANDKIFIAKWRFGEGNNEYKSEFEIHERGKELSYEIERSIDTPEGLNDYYGEKIINIDFGEVYDKTIKEVEKFIRKVEPPYLRDKVDVAVGLEPDHDFYYSKVSAYYKNPVSLLPTLEDMEKVTDILADETEAIFHDVLDKEVNKIR